MASLEFISGTRSGEFHKLAEGPTVIGRFPNCDLVLQLHTISRRHTRISYADGNYLVEDLGSLNGTYVNGQRIDKPTLLKDQDVLQLFDVVIIFHTGNPTQPSSWLPDSSSSSTSSSRRRLQILDDDDTNRAPIPREVVHTSTAGDGGRGSVSPEVKLSAVLEIARSLGSSLDVEEVLPRILDSLFELFSQANRGYILLIDPVTDELAPRALKRRDQSDTFGPISRTIAQRVMTQGEAILSTDISGDEQFRDSESVHAMQIRSMMCAPLIGPSHEACGILHIETADPRRHFDRDDLELLVTIATVAGQAVEYAQAHADRLRLHRQQHEMAMARDVQRHFLPEERPELPGYEFFDYYHPAEEVGGDYYGYIPLPDGRLALALGDVSGKGVPAALLMARLCSETAACLSETASPGEAVALLGHEALGPMLGDRFVTFVLCVLNPQTHELVLVNAGHPAPLLRRGKDVSEIGHEEKGLPLGFGVQEPYRELVLPLEPKDCLLIYTDGISEAQNAAEQIYTRQRISQLVATAPAGIAPLCEALLDDVEQFVHGHPQSDDMCVLGLERL